MIQTKRVYEPPEAKDGFRILVDRLWPRGINKRNAKIDLWVKEIAPTNNLRKWFNHVPEKWDEFKQKYFKELDELSDTREFINSITEHLQKGNVTLLYAAKDTQHNNAVALLEYLHIKHRI
jgi:uncharacterized protein YeaO (DUF488 family)